MRKGPRNLARACVEVMSLLRRAGRDGDEAELPLRTFDDQMKTFLSPFNAMLDKIIHSLT